MRFLLDTHTLIWFFQNSPNLSKRAREHIFKNNSVKVSIVSLWELAIKRSLNKFSFDGTISEIIDEIKESGFELITIKGEDIEVLETLPFIHRDPFDRILIAQALTDNLTIITKDENIRLYDAIKTLW